MEKLVFSHAIEGYLRAVRPVLDASLTDELLALGIDASKPLLPVYPLDVLRQALVVGARRMSPTLSQDDALVALGRRHADSYAETLVGRALKTAIRLIGPARTLDRIARQFRTANNYSESKVKHHAPGKAQLWCNDVSHPPYYSGLIAGMLTIAGGTHVSVKVNRHDAEGAFFDIEWM